ncbi:MAG: hypothetical protein MHM6MM_002575 [Cercozoa sp. M6MM]
MEVPCRTAPQRWQDRWCVFRALTRARVGGRVAALRLDLTDFFAATSQASSSLNMTYSGCSTDTHADQHDHQQDRTAIEYAVKESLS